MPKQEVFFEQVIRGKRVEVLKSYDQSYARNAFGNMNDTSLRRLWLALGPENIYYPADLPSLNDQNDLRGEAEAFLWDELLEQAREENNLFSFFIVNEVIGDRTESLYVSPDWPSAEAFVKERMDAVD